MLDPVDVILTPVDPVRGLGAALSELSRLAELDPKLKAAQAEVGEYLQQLDQGDVPDIVGPVLWVWAREVLRSPQGLIQLHAAFNDGGATLQAVEETLRTTLRAEVLHELVGRPARPTTTRHWLRRSLGPRSNSRRPPISST